MQGQSGSRLSLSLWDPPGMNAVTLVGAIGLVVLGIRVYRLIMRGDAAESWWAARAWGWSTVMAGVFFCAAWLLPRLALNLLRLNRGVPAFIAVVAGLFSFAVILGRITSGTGGMKAGVVSGLLATTCLAGAVFVWVIGIGMAYLGPGLH